MTKKSKSKRGRKQRRKAKVDAAETSVTKQDDDPLSLKMQRLQIGEENEDDLLEEAIKLATSERGEILRKNCVHGYEYDEYIERFCRSYYTAYYTAISDSRQKIAAGLVRDPFKEALEATVSEFTDVWSDPSKAAKVAQYLASKGTVQILEGDEQCAGICAYLTSYFEQFTKVVFEKSQAVLDSTKFLELIRGDDHTLTSFFRRRIPCSCLDEIYKEVKSIKKKGFCLNSRCKHSFIDPAGLESKWKLDRSSLMSCARCRHAYYCSVECQKADWPRHESDCDKAVARTVAFEEGKWCTMPEAAK